MWGAWFGGNGGQKRKDAPKKAILDLRQQLDMLQKRERHLENQMAKQDEIARENVTTNKTGRQVFVGEWFTGRSGRNMSQSRGGRGCLTRADIALPSCPQCPKTQKATRALPRTNKRPNLDARAANLLHRIRQHQPRNPRRHEERRRSHETNPRQDDHGGRRHHDVSLPSIPNTL